METFVYYISQLFYFIISFFIIIIVLGLLFKFILKKFNPNSNKIKVYGLFIGLSNKDILSLSLITLRYIFIIWCIFDNNYVNIIEDIHFYILLLTSISYDLLNKRFFYIIFNVINNIIIYSVLYAKMIFYQYITMVDNVWYVLIILVLLNIFIAVYCTYFYVFDIKKIMKNNKYIKKKTRGINNEKNKIFS